MSISCSDINNLRVASFIATPTENEKKKRGRPKKQPVFGDDTKEKTPIVVIKKTRKKHDSVLKTEQSKMCDMVVIKNYIVQLYIKPSDIESVNEPHNGSTIREKYLCETDKTHESLDSYYKLVNDLEIPHEDKNKITIVNTDIIIKVLPENVPIHLFNYSKTNGKSDVIARNTNYDYVTGNTENKLLPLFDIDGVKWPTSSPYACWNCDAYFKGPPIGIPEKESGETFHCQGNFCRFECVARYLFDHESGSEYWNKYSLLCIMYKKAMSLDSCIKVKMAPPRETLLKYGGKYTHEEYHKTIDDNKIIDIYKLPLIPILFYIAETSQSIDIQGIMNKHNNKLK
jgi:hypothetical protein